MNQKSFVSCTIKRVALRIMRIVLGLPVKQFNEREFWREEKALYVEWYRGTVDDLYGLPPPEAAEKVTGYTEELNALYTLSEVGRKAYSGYISRLALPRNYFAGKHLIDIGCGPMGMALAFHDCRITGIDPLSDVYRRLGYPVDHYSSRMEYRNASAENLPFADNSIDAVIAVNSLDHVDSFAATASEICRVLKDGGPCRFEIHYHTPTSCEPWALNDDLMSEHFGEIHLRKLMEKPYGPGGEETIALWGNTDIIYREE